MQLSRLIRSAVALGLTLLFVGVLWAILFFTETAFGVWDRLQQGPTWFLIVYGIGFLVLSVGTGVLVFRLLLPIRRSPGAASRPEPAVPDRAELERRLANAEKAGADPRGAREELERLARRKAAGTVHVAFFGEISSGKSSLVQALVPDASPEVCVRGGTTREIREYRWQSPAGDELVLTDMPGTNEVGAELDRTATAEALRAHVVVYVCDGDLSRSQHAELSRLLDLGKPTVLVLNKSDLYPPQELAEMKDRLAERLLGRRRTELVTAQGGGRREVIRLLPDGTEERVERDLPPEVEVLRQALQRRLDEDPGVLDSLRDSAVFVLAASHLEEAERENRQRKAQELVTKYARRAVVGALAAVTPGTDLLIQGYLGASLIKELARLYEVPVRQVDTDLLLDLAQKHIGRTLTLVLAVAGNALKAFPGVGTLAGGLAHAVAYGLIFDSLGRAVADSLATRGALRPVQAAHAFEENLSEDLESAARRMARLALAVRDETRAGADRSG